MPEKLCWVCEKPCDDTYGYGPDECHCSKKCHDIAMKAHAREKMTPEEREFFDSLEKPHA